MEGTEEEGELCHGDPRVNTDTTAAAANIHIYVSKCRSK